MLPLVDDTVLQNNPDFAALYSKLTTSILNADGSTKNHPAAKERSRVTEELNEYRLKAAKEHLLADAISDANPHLLQTKHAPAPSLTRRPRPQQPATTPIADLPSPLLDLLVLLPPLLTASTDLPPESTALLLSSPPISDFPTHLPQLASLVSTTLHSSAVHLARIANPSTNPSYIHRTIPSLPTIAASLARTISSHKTSLTLARLTTLTTLTALLQSQTSVLSQLLRALEAKHGPVARSLELRATESSLTAQTQEAEAQCALWRARRETYTPEAARALANYAAHLQDARARLSEAVNSLRAELQAYGVSVGVGVAGDDGGEMVVVESGKGGYGGGDKEKVMREMARVYRDMGRQVEEVRADLERSSAVC
ncbi:hypothetical protein N657DRAFT_680608 [Parathielavia appendiculata]|uniref:Uncharacterized protein n=1 Tax=Parathielavia appendiculata TaxID=2587402 RepID=A0AAN6U1F1_9PEZI|nr:hypothetical protein N657DRAFT_680608 [Parathielavia appendiculata]